MGCDYEMKTNPYLSFVISPDSNLMLVVSVESNGKSSHYFSYNINSRLV